MNFLRKNWYYVGAVIFVALAVVLVVFWNDISVLRALERRARPVTPEDLRIVTRAKSLLQNESVWNRGDDRECADDEAKGQRSLFCALQKATIEVLGEYDHRRVALQEVRFAVEDATRGQAFEHRIMDYNNGAKTTINDIWQVLDVAMERMRARLPQQ